MPTVTFTDNPYQPISDAYNGRSIFVTGASGFLGKVFVEKILYRCPKIDKIYVLMRDSSKAKAEERLKKMLDCPLFKRLKDERPEDLRKIIPIMGDLCKPELGINGEDEFILTNNVSMVFHFAATVKFNESLNLSFNVNVEGTRKVLDLCAKMKDLQVFVHMSTAYSNANREVTDEVVYAPMIPLSDVDGIIKQEFTAQQTEKILNGVLNTYILSKNVAEGLVAEFHEKHRLPVVIVRPSIVIACKDEPLCGWIDNWYGATALLVAIKKGVIRVLCCDGDNVTDLIPADYVSNLAIVVGARCRSVEKIEVYNSCSSEVNPLTNRKLVNIVLQSDNESRTMNYLPLPAIMFTRWRWFMLLLTFLFEKIPTYLLDCVTRILGKKRVHLKMLSKMNGVRNALDSFTRRSWLMRSRNTSALAATLSAQDARIFACDAAAFDWHDVIPTYIRGVHKYLMDTKA